MPVSSSPSRLPRFFSPALFTPLLALCLGACGGGPEDTHATTATVEVRVHPRSLRIVVPAASRAVAYAEESAPAGFALQLP